MSDYLIHHGILGQKWGRLNGPPYPLSKSDYSASEKKADDKNGNKSTKKSGLSSTQKKVLIGVGITAASVLAIYGGYKLYKAYSASNNDTFANDFIDGTYEEAISITELIILVLYLEIKILNLLSTP